MKNKIYVVAPLLAAAIFYVGEFSVPVLNIENLRAGSAVKLREEVASSKGVRLPIVWGDLGAQLIQAGVIDAGKFEDLYSSRGGLDDEMKEVLYGTNNKELIITRENAGFLLNVLWAFGIGNKNEILEKGPMADPRYGGAGRFASTGGWTLASGSTMNHFSKHSFIILTREQQELVERMSKNIYRPCCNNSTHFPDCNHGMAMLGLLELLVSQNVSEKEIYRTALAVNSYWFPDTYVAIAEFLQTKGFDWRKAEPKDLLGYNFSSATGYQQILSEMKPTDQGSGGTCGV